MSQHQPQLKPQHQPLLLLQLIMLLHQQQPQLKPVAQSQLTAHQYSLSNYKGIAQVIL
jgi:hypothetical protein